MKTSSFQQRIAKHIATDAGTKGAFSGEPKGNTQTKTAKADVNTKIHQGAVAGNIKATDNPITIGVKKRDEKSIFNNFSPSFTKTALVTTEMRERAKAVAPLLLTAKTKRAESIIA